MERIPLSNETFEGNNNAYLFADGPETVLVDTGDRLPGTYDQLAEELASHGVAVADIDRILLSHWHGDHRGLAGPIQQESGATVHVHEADAGLVAGDDAAWEAITERQIDCFERWGMPGDKQQEVTAVLDGVTWRDTAPEVEPFTDGECFQVNDQALRVVHAPGHAAGLCLFEIEGESQEVLSSDALLPKYTPNVGGADVRVERPLETYVETLREIAEAGYDRAWPGHRGVIEDPTARAEFIVEHHRERAYRVLDALDRLGPCDTWTVSHDLFGELEHIHILHGPGESSAHLQHLEREGSVVRDGDEYRLAEGVADRLDDADGTWPLDGSA